MFLKYIFHKIKKCASLTGFSHKTCKKMCSVSENEKIKHLKNMGIHGTGLKTGVQNSLQNWKILKIGQVTVKNRFFFS